MIDDVPPASYDVVVVHHRAPELLRATLEALTSQQRAPAKVVVVDDGPGTDVAAVVRSRPGVILDATGSNVGYAAAANLGIARHCTAEFVLLMSHECVLKADASAKLLSVAASDSTIAVAAPVLALLSQPGVVWSAGGGLRPFARTPYHQGAGQPLTRFAGRDGAVDVPWVDGAAWLIRRSAFDTVGPLDEAYFLYSEELDFQTRVRRAGWRVVCVRGAVGWQEPGMTPPYLEARNITRWAARLGGRRALLASVLRQIRLALVALARGRAWEMRARLRGLRDVRLDRVDTATSMRRS